MILSFQGAHFAKDIILVGVRWYVAYPLSYRDGEELMEERGVAVDHATIQRWVVKYSPQRKRRSTAGSARCGSVGGWMKPTSRSKASGTTSIAP